MGNLAVLALRLVLVALLAGSLFVQTVMVVLLSHDLDDVTELAHGPAPILVIIVLGILSAQVVLVCVWRLVGMVRRGTVFSAAAFRYVHVVIGAADAAGAGRRP